VAWPTQAAREWLPELADPWIPGTGKPIQYVPVQTLAPARALVPVSAATPVYLIVASSTIKSEPLAAKPEPSVDMQRSYPHNMVKVIPRMPGPQDTTQYWVQVGAYKTQVNAQQAFNRVMGAGFSPVFEEHRGLVRVLIPWVRGSKMQETAERLYNAGFMEILLWDKPPKS
jgi:cell division protein FtsN